MAQNTLNVNYKLPRKLNPFQLDMYVHLINWKWKNISKKPGVNCGIDYDAILPKDVQDKYPVIYPPVLQKFKDHHKNFPFRIHKFFHHMASSQAANINLFLPVLLHKDANKILKAVNPDFDRLATKYLDNGFRIEYWDKASGNLNDKNETSGTDSDIAIAYYNKESELCLWLIEHKLTEEEFTTCGGFKSKGKKSNHDCSRSFSDILKDKNYCYYHSAKIFEYWNVTDKHQSFFVNHKLHNDCPFKNMNQLWRNQLLALSIEDDRRQNTNDESREPFKHCHFSIVKHKDNTYLDGTIKEYETLINNNNKFSVFTSSDIINSASKLNDPQLNNWISWYKDLYKV